MKIPVAAGLSFEVCPLCFNLNNRSKERNKEGFNKDSCGTCDMCAVERFIKACGKKPE